MSVRLRAGSATDVGRLRSIQQDNLLIGSDLYVVADGMGGHQGGEVASEIAVDVLGQGLSEPTVDGLVALIEDANDVIIDRARSDKDLLGMGTTVVALALVDEDGEERLAVANVGDSRVYRFQDGDLLQITEDHSLVADLVRLGRISPEEAEDHPRRNVVTRALGIDPNVMIDVQQVLPFIGDRYVLCSDGLFNEVPADRIASVLRRLDSPDDAASELVRLANESGGRDNITVLIVDVVDDGGRSEAASAALTGARSGLASHDDPAGFTTALDEDDDRPDVDETVDEKPLKERMEAEKEPRPKRFTWRVALFLTLVLAVFIAAFVIINAAGRDTYYATLVSDRVLVEDSKQIVGRIESDDQHVVIMRGRPGGLLWIDPEVEVVTNLTRHDLKPLGLTRVQDERVFSSLAKAKAFVLALDTVKDAPSPAIGATTTTSTSTSTTSTTKKPTTTTTTTN